VRNQLSVNLALVPLRRRITNAILAELLANPLGAVAVTSDVADTVRPQYLTELTHRFHWTMRHLYLTDYVNKRPLIFRIVRYTQRRTVTHTTTHIHKPAIKYPLLRQAQAPSRKWLKLRVV
jgi:hypothetical protein